MKKKKGNNCKPEEKEELNYELFPDLTGDSGVEWLVNETKKSKSTKK